MPDKRFELSLIRRQAVSAAPKGRSNIAEAACLRRLSLVDPARSVIGLGPLSFSTIARLGPAASSTAKR
jgi:hypothetical protein